MTDETNREWERRLRALGDRINSHDVLSKKNVPSSSDTEHPTDAGDHDSSIVPLDDASYDESSYDDDTASDDGDAADSSYDESQSEQPGYYDEDEDEVHHGDNDGYTSSYTDYGHETVVPDTLDDVISALQDIRNAIGGNASMKSFDDSGNDAILGVDWGYDPNGDPIVAIGRRGRLPLLLPDGMPGTDSGLLLTQPDEGPDWDDDSPSIPLDEVIDTITAIMDGDMKKMIRVRDESEDVFKAAKIADGYMHNTFNPHPMNDIEEAAREAIRLVEKGLV